MKGKNMTKFKHDVNEVIEGCAEALAIKKGFNPLQVLRYFELFGMNFFENTPKVPYSEKENWYYLRDRDTHAAVIYNHETKVIQFIQPEKYWVKGVMDMFRMKEEIIQEKLKNNL
jgi:hypothetical protein